MDTNPIQAFITPDGRYYANINGISKGSITCYFDSNGNLISHTLEQGRLYEQLLAKLQTMIDTNGVQLNQTKAELNFVKRKTKK